MAEMLKAWADSALGESAWTQAVELPAARRGEERVRKNVEQMVKVESGVGWLLLEECGAVAQITHLRTRMDRSRYPRFCSRQNISGRAV